MSWDGDPRAGVPRLRGLLVVGVPCCLGVPELVWGGVSGGCGRWVPVSRSVPSGCTARRCFWRFQPCCATKISSDASTPSPTQKVSQAAWGGRGVVGRGLAPGPAPHGVHPHLEDQPGPGAEGLLLCAQLVALPHGQDALPPQLLQPGVHCVCEGAEVGVRPRPQPEDREPGGPGGNEQRAPGPGPLPGRSPAPGRAQDPVPFRAPIPSPSSST